MLIFVTVATRPAPIDPRSPQLSTSHLDRLTKDLQRIKAPLGSVALSAIQFTKLTRTVHVQAHTHRASLIGLIIGGLTCSEVMLSQERQTF